MVAQSLAPTITTSLAAIQGTNGTSTPNGLLKSSADSPATPASTSAAAPTSGAGKPEKAAKPAPRLAIDTTAEQLSAALGDKWEDYGRELNLFIVGKRTRAELQETLDLVLGSDPALKKLHNNLLMGILANASRDPPPQNGSFSGWNRNKKRKEPMTGRVKGSTKQKRLKTEIMALGPTERNRIKAFKAVSELEPAERKLCPPVPGAILESRRAKSAPRLPKDKNFQPLPTTQIQTIKGYNVPLASETLELPSVEDTFDRAQGMASEYLLNGVQDKVPELVLDGLESHLKNLITQIIVRVRANRENTITLRQDGKPSTSILRPANHPEPTSITVDDLGLSWELSPYILVESIPPPLRLWNSFIRDDAGEEDPEPIYVPPAPEPLRENAPVSESLTWQRSKIEYERRALASVLDEILV